MTPTPTPTSAGQETPRFWCHQCAAAVDTRVDEPSEEVCCGQCSGNFVEEIEEVGVVSLALRGKEERIIPPLVLRNVTCLYPLFIGIRTIRRRISRWSRWRTRRPRRSSLRPLRRITRVLRSATSSEELPTAAVLCIFDNNISRKVMLLIMFLLLPFLRWAGLLFERRGLQIQMKDSMARRRFLSE